MRILIADDHGLMRLGLRSVLESRGWIVCAEAETGREAVEKAGRLKPEIAILDIAMPELNGIDAARRIRKVSPRTEILILSAHYSESVAEEIMAAGINGYLVKSDAALDLPKAVETLSKHQTFFSPLAIDAVLHISDRSAGVENGVADHRLTSREREVLQLLAEGRVTKEVATLLGISTKTAETHRANLMRKMKSHSVAELVHYAVRSAMFEL